MAAHSDFFLFVSHVSEDRAAAMDIVKELERRGVWCWIAPRDVHPGKPFDDEIAEAIEACNAFLLVFSERCNQSDYVRREVTVAGDSHKVIIPFRIENVLPARGLRIRLSDLHWIDEFASREKAIEELIRTLVPSGAEYRKRRRDDAGWQRHAGEDSVHYGEDQHRRAEARSERGEDYVDLALRARAAASGYLVFGLVTDTRTKASVYNARVILSFVQDSKVGDRTQFFIKTQIIQDRSPVTTASDMNGQFCFAILSQDIITENAACVVSAVAEGYKPVHHTILWPTKQLILKVFTTTIPWAVALTMDETLGRSPDESIDIALSPIR